MTIWNNLKLPAQGRLNLLMVDTKSDFMWSWAKNSEGHIGFVVELSSGAHDVSSFEQTKELVVDIKIFDGQPMLSVFFIKEGEQRPLEELFLDLITKTSHIKNEYELINHLNARFNAWCLLFKSGRNKLKKNEILGLAAELTFIKNWVNILGESIEDWVGPLKKHQDFISIKNKRAYEIKLGNWEPESVSISSMEQLDFEGDLTLVVYPGKISDKNESGALSIPMIVKELEGLFKGDDLLVLTNRLIAVGYEKKECEKVFFEIGTPLVFEVSENFPKLTRDRIAREISKCSYTLNLADLDPYKSELKN